METLNEGILLQVNATIIAGIFIFLSLLSFNVFDLPPKLAENINRTDLNNEQFFINPETISFKWNVVANFLFIMGMMFPFIISSIIILISNNFYAVRIMCSAGFVVLFVIIGYILYSSYTTILEQNDLLKSHSNFSS